MPTSDVPGTDVEEPPGPQPQIRGTRPDDCAAIAALINLPGVRYNTLRLPFETPEAVRRRLEARAGSDTALVALLGDELVGWADMHRFDGRRAHVGELGMGVHDAHCGSGIGTALLAALIDTADRWLGLRRLHSPCSPTTSERLAFTGSLDLPWRARCAPTRFATAC